VRRRAWLTALALFGCGCGYIGEPLPPLLHIPTKVKDLAVVQRGANIITQFTIPQIGTEGVAIKGPVELDLRAGPAAEPFHADTWAASARRPEPGPAPATGMARFSIPITGWQGKEIVLGVRVVGPTGKHLGWSDFVVIAVVAPPATPGQLQATGVAEGVRLTWRGTSEAYRVFRASGDKGAFSLAATVAGAEWLDRDTTYGTRYRYLVQGVVKTPGTREAESEPSAEAAITPVDTFPPAVPAGLTAVPASASVELTWERNPEPDLAGYKVYRATDGAFERLAETGEAPAFSDRRISPGKTYRYSVSAVDRSGNESGRSTPVEVSVP
jgi:hypothetical protein